MSVETSKEISQLTETAGEKSRKTSLDYCHHIPPRVWVLIFISYQYELEKVYTRYIFQCINRISYMTEIKQLNVETSFDFIIIIMVK